MKKEINALDYASEITNQLIKGILLTTKADGKVNSMTIGWGMIGIEWGKPVFVALVRTGRFTKEQLDKNPFFTLNIPWGNTDRKAIGLCGTISGRNTNKINEAGLTIETAENIDVPAIKEYPLTLECKIIYKQAQDPSEIPPEDAARFYPQNVDSSNTGANKDYHILYHAEIVKSYIIQE